VEREDLSGGHRWKGLYFKEKAVVKRKKSPRICMVFCTCFWTFFEGMGGSEWGINLYKEPLN